MPLPLDQRRILAKTIGPSLLLRDGIESVHFGSYTKNRWYGFSFTR